MSFEERYRCSGVVVALKTRSQLCLYRCSTDAAVQAVLLVIFLLIRELRTTLKPLYSCLGKSWWNTDKRCGYGASQVLCLVLKGQPLMLIAILDLFSWSSCPPSFVFSFYFYRLYTYRLQSRGIADVSKAFLKHSNWFLRWYELCLRNFVKL